MLSSRTVISAIVTLCAAQGVWAFDVPRQSDVVEGCHRGAVETRLRQKHLDAVEGIWYYPDERLTVAVERVEDTPLAMYRLALVESEDKSLDKGVVVGYMQTTAEKERMRIWLYSLSDDGHLTHPVESVADMEDDSHIRIYKKKLKVRVSVNLSRFLPSVFGGGVRIYPFVKDNETINPGMVKIWPDDEADRTMIF